MTQPPARPRPPAGIYRRFALALAIGLASGVAAAAAGLPLPWMLGPMIGNTLAAILGVPVAGPVALRGFVIPVIGVLLGSAFGPGIVDRLADWALTLALMPAFIAAAAGLSYVLYRRAAGYDPATAFFSAMPGGLNEMLILGAEAGADERRVALAHASRILVVVSFVVLFFGIVLGVTTGGDDGRPVTGFGDISATDAALLASCGLAGVWLGRRLRFPAAALTGPMLLSGAAHLTALVEVPPPTPLVIAAQVIIGTIIGCRFAGVAPREIGRDLAFGAASSTLMIGAALAAAVALTLATGADMRQSFLAYSPGGLTEMSLLALAMGQDVAYVSAMHVVRIVLVVLGVPVLNRRLRNGGPGPR
jgi:membrane AbrB-like protein